MTRLQSHKRDRNAAHKVYVPNNARDNQYLIAQFQLSPQLIRFVDPSYNSDEKSSLNIFYKKLSNQIFTLCQHHNIEAVSFIANDKIPIVRFNMDFERIETDEKIMFFYHPTFYRGQTSFFDDDHVADKIKILFLATGDDIRVNAAKFHQQVRDVITRLSQEFSAIDLDIDIRDHQHITYDLFANNKSKQLSQSHKFRPIATRYQAHDVEFTNELYCQTFVVADVPVDKVIRRLVPLDEKVDAPYETLYSQVEQLFKQAMIKAQISNGLMIANNKMPLVRYSTKTDNSHSKIFQMINSDNDGLSSVIHSVWDGRVLCDVIKFVFVVPSDQCTDRGYGKYINQVTKVIEKTTEKLTIDPCVQQILVRVYQHLGYTLNASKVAL
jgi:hypothetical protein